MKRLLVYFKGLILRAMTAPLFKFFEVLLELLVPILMKRIIDEGIADRDNSLIFGTSALIAALALSGLIFALFAQYFSAYVATTFSSRVRDALFSHIMYLSFRDGDRLGKETLTARMTSDVQKVQTAVNLALRLVLRSPFIVAGSAVMAYIVSPSSLPIFLITTALLALVIFLIMRLTVPMFSKVQSSLDRLILRTRENVFASRVIRAFNRRDDEEKRYADSQDDLYTSSVRSSRISALLNPATFIIINVALAFILIIGGDGVNTGDLSKGDVIALVNYMSAILVELIKISNLVTTLNKGLVSANRIAAVLDTQSEKDALFIGKELPVKNHSIEFRGVSYRYPGASGNAIDSLSFKIEAGETLGIIGGTGSGKSTLAALIPGYILPTEGEILIDGVPAEEFSPASRRRNVGFVSQSPAVFAGTLEYNIKFGNPDTSDKDVLKATADSCSDEFIAQKEGGLEFVALQNGRNLSGGQRQRINTARAFARDAGILILDDASSALDNATDKKMRNAIKNMKQDPTCVIISQRCGSVRGADKILVLENGRAEGLGTHESLLNTCALYREMNDLQYGSEE